MGACTDYRRYMNATKQEAEEQFRADQCQSAYDDGNSYSGCIGVMPSGVNWVSKIFTSPLDAERHITDNHEKWDQAMGAEFADDAGDTCGFSIGGWCSS